MFGSGTSSPASAQAGAKNALDPARAGGPRLAFATGMDSLRLSFRTLRRAPGFTIAAVLVLAIGVGGSTAIFSVLRGVVLRQ